MPVYQISKSVYEVHQLQNEININVNIVPSCLSIVGDVVNNFVLVEFAAALSQAEETTLNSIVADHIPDPVIVDIAQLPLSTLDSKKLSVHPSYKPEVDGTTTYAVWVGAGDDTVSNPSILGEGDLLHFEMVPGVAQVSKDVKFDHAAFGRVWIHEAYMKFDNGGPGDYISGDVIASASVVQTSVNLDLILDGDYIKYSPSGPGTGTHGFGGTPNLIPRTYSNDGSWDFDGTNLTPNLTDTGQYNISTVDTVVHRYVNRIPVTGSSPYFSMTSDETTELNPGYFLRITCHNVSDTTWNLSSMLEIYREQTIAGE